MNQLYKPLVDQYADGQAFTQDTIELISKYLSVVKYKKKQLLIQENQIHNFVYYVIKGALRSYYLNNGQEINSWFALENDTVGSLLNFRNKPSRESIELLEDSILIAIDFKLLQPWMKTHVQVANFIANIIVEYTLYLEEKLYDSQMKSSMDRYHCLVEKQPEIFQRIPLTHIASYLGMSRETLSRLRAK